jgi:anti-sigma-K factor RskA
MQCEGFRPVTYDLYVLGLLDLTETQRLNDHIERQCPTCLSGVGKSMRLWCVFTSSLGAAEPSPHLKQRLQEISDLSRSVLTFPKTAAAENQEGPPRWLQIALAAAGAALLTVCGWYAGHTSGSLDHQHLLTRVTQSEEELSSSRLRFREQQQETKRIRNVPASVGQGDTADRISALRDQLARSQDEADQYKALLNRKQRDEDDQKDLIMLLASPGARLLPLKGSQPSPASVGYAVVVPNSKLVFVGSNLSDLPRGREYQIWLACKSEIKPYSAGIFVPDEAGRAFVLVDDGAVVSDPTDVFVTDEPAGGSASPTGSRFLTSGD